MKKQFILTAGGINRNNALKEELSDVNSVVANFATTAADGKNTGQTIIVWI